VQAVVVQPDGKIIISGLFDRVNGVVRTSIARLNADGTLDSAWSTTTDGPIDALALSGNTLYVGGLFSSINGQPRSSIAALDITTGSVTAWNPNTTGGGVFTIAVSGGTVYVGGAFSNIGGQARNHLAAIDPVTGNATAWDPNPNRNVVSSIVVVGSTVYVGGDFTQIGGQLRTALAAVDAATGNATPWAPIPSLGFPAVDTLAVTGNTVYAGGFFSVTSGGQTRTDLAAFDATTAAFTSWNPNPNDAVSGITLSGSTVYVTGRFTSIGGQSRRYLAAIDAGTGNATGWNPSPDRFFNTNAITVVGTTVLIGGFFIQIGGETVLNFARLDATTGLHVAGVRSHTGFWGRPSVLMQQDDGRIVVGGNFQWVASAGVVRKNILRLNTDGTLDTSWDPAADALIFALTKSGAKIYAGGAFSNIGGQPRNGIAELDMATGAATAWNPNPSNSVTSLAASGSSIYAGGAFTSIGGQPRNRIAALDIATGTATAWDPNANGIVNTLAVSGGTIFAGGAFTNIGGQVRNRIASLDASSGLANPWNPNANGTVNKVIVSGSTIFAGGAFTNIGGQPRNRIAAVDASTGLATPWDPNASGGFSPDIRALDLSGGTVYTGGSFTNIGGQPRNGIAALDAVTGSALSWDANADDFRAEAVLPTGGGLVYVCGRFANLLGQRRDGLAAVSAVTVPVAFFTLTPCRVADTRGPIGLLGGPALAANTDRTFPLAGTCGIPSSAVAVSINITVTQPDALGDLRLYPGGTPLPLVSSLNYRAGQTRANNVNIPLSSGGTLAVRCVQAFGNAHFIIDVNGYYQ
jgi:uncharacterized delta-60 repeat protein